MEYKNKYRLNEKVSLLGFGCMRFPTLDNGEIDEEEARKMIDNAYRHGVNYFDTAYVYHDGKSEPFTGRVLDGYDRSSYYLATKLPCWLIETIEDAKRIFEHQLERLHKDYLDFYLLHSLNKEDWDRMVQLGVIEYCESLKAAGRIRYLGFSFHDSYSVFEEIINYRDWDFCQIQLNYMDINEQAGVKGYQLVEKMGIPVIVMEPVKGGSLANLPDDIAKVFKSIAPDASMASWALRWTGSFPGVRIILSGMSTPQQVSDNLKTFDHFVPLDEEEQKAVEIVTDMMKNRVHNNCTSCRYCMPCPFGVDIPRNIGIWNLFGIYQNRGRARFQWKNLSDDKKAKNCTQCGKCEEACPQKISIRKDLASLQTELDALQGKG